MQQLKIFRLFNDKNVNDKTSFEENSRQLYQYLYGYTDCVHVYGMVFGKMFTLSFLLVEVTRIVFILFIHSCIFQVF